MIIIVLITIDQSILLDINYKVKQDPNANVTTHKQIRDIIMICTVLVAVIGFIFYYIKKRGDYGEDFSYISFILGSNGHIICKSKE
jgi:magnesium-transporting ATPase (P-type)